MFNTSLNNALTRGNRAEITSWGIPDYSSGISISSGYIAEYNGMVLIERGIGSAKVYLYVDGVLVDSNESNTSNEGGSLKAFAGKDSVVTWTTTNITGTPTFFPCIGG